MLLTIHDARLQKVAFIDNDKYGTLNYYNDVWSRDLETASSTFEFAVFKKSIKSDIGVQRAYSHLNEKAFISFNYKGKSYVFNVMTIEENEQTIKCFCENLNLELINEYANPYKADRAMTFAEYCDAMHILSFSYLSIGVNEIADQRQTLEWEGTDTKLARLLSLANKFDAEIEFDTKLNADSSIKSFVVNVYHEHDETHQGVGRVRSDIRLAYRKNMKSIKRKIDKIGIYNAVRPTGRSNDGNTVTISSLPNMQEKNSKGQVEFYQSGDMLYAPLSRDMYPAAFTSETVSDQWIRKDMTVESDNPTVIRANALRELKKNCYPAITYEVDGFIDGDIGDTIKVDDDGFQPYLFISARISNQKISFTNPSSNKTTLSNFKALENRLSGNIQARLEQLIEEAKPYTIMVSTDNGTVFKNGTGQSVVTPTLLKGSKIVQGTTWRFTFNNNVTAGQTFTVNASQVTNTALLQIAAYIGNSEVARHELPFAGVSDGVKGNDGKTSYVHFAYADSKDGKTGFNLTQNGSKRYVGVYTDFEQTASTDYKRYTWSDAAGGVEVGGVNLIKNSAFPANLNHWLPENANHLSVATHGWYYNFQKPLFLISNPGKTEQFLTSERFDVEPNTTYTINFRGFHSGELSSLDVWFLGRKTGETSNYTIANNLIASRQLTANKCEDVSVTFNSGLANNGYIRFDNNGTTTTTAARLYIGEIDFYKGNTPRKWQPNPADLQEQIDEKANAKLTQEQLNALSERSQIQEAELKAKATMEALSDLEKAYKARVEATEAEVKKAEADLAEAGKRIDLLVTQFGGFRELKTFIDTYMSSSNEGLIIGKNDASSTIKVSSDRISMFSAGREVMYISQGVIHIDNGIFTASVQIGRFITEQYNLNPDMNVIRYVG